MVSLNIKNVINWKEIRGKQCDFIKDARIRNTIFLFRMLEHAREIQNKIYLFHRLQKWYLINDNTKNFRNHRKTLSTWKADTNNPQSMLGTVCVSIENELRISKSKHARRMCFLSECNFYNRFILRELEDWLEFSICEMKMFITWGRQWKQK